MKYSESIKQDTRACRFCVVPDEQVVVAGSTMSLILARAPYTDGHLLVVSHRHVENWIDLTADERQELNTFIEKAIVILNANGASFISHLLRDGEASVASGKSQAHFHYHIIADCNIVAKHLVKLSDSDNRKFFSDEECLAMKEQYQRSL